MISLAPFMAGPKRQKREPAMLIRLTPTAPPVAEEGDTFIVSVRLKSGRFESSIEVPLFCTDAERQRFTEAWMALMVAGIKCGQGKKS